MLCRKILELTFNSNRWDFCFYQYLKNNNSVLISVGKDNKLKIFVSVASKIQREFKDASPVIQVPCVASPFEHPRQYLQNKYIYLTMSYRARGLSVGVNLNPDKYCNFDCVYCEVNKQIPGGAKTININELVSELNQTMESICGEGLRQLPFYSDLPAELLELKHIALSGDGEPTLCPQFAEVVQEVAHLRALGKFPFFKITLITNSSGLNLPWVQTGLMLLTSQDEIWAKLDAGTQKYLYKINRTKVPLEEILANIKLIGKRRPIVIQSLFPLINNEYPPEAEIEQYARRLLELKESGAQISYVQVHSARRPVTNPDCSHLPLKVLSNIARVVREMTGLKVEVY